MTNISFFSYKGGAGRTSLLYNTLPFIAKKLGATEQEPIVVIDLDIDSKGLTYLIDRECDINSVQVLKGEISNNPRMACTIKDHPFFSKLLGIGEDIGLDEKHDRAVLFVPAPKGRSMLGTSNIDGQNISLNKFRDICKAYGCKAIVMDTPTGNQLSGECALSISQKIVTVMRITKQFNVGTKEFLSSNLVQGFSKKEFIILPNAVPQVPYVDGKPKYDMEKIIRRIANNAKSALGTDIKNYLNLTFVENGMTGVNEVNSFKFEELNLTKEQETRVLIEDERQAMDIYELLAKELVK